jgi:DNA repair exonuclease SbcCD ATPase subunit
MTEPTSRYFAFIKKSIKGPYNPKDAAQLPGFLRSTLVCPEALLGQWREAHLEAAFQVLLDPAAPVPVKPRPPLTHEAADNRAVRSLLEKAILKNSQLDNDVKLMKREYAREKNNFNDELKKKEAEVKALTEKLKRTSGAQAARTEHPSWEHLYKTLRKRAEEKLCEVTQTLAAKHEENLRLRNQMQNMVDTYESSKRNLLEKGSKERETAGGELKELRSELEEKEMVVKTMADTIQSLLSKNEELQRIMLDERNDYEAQNTRFCEEIGKLKGEAKWKQAELEEHKTGLMEALSRIKEFESAGNLKTREQEELYEVIHAKVRILSGYFENLESRLKYAFKKA